MNRKLRMVEKELDKALEQWHVDTMWKKWSRAVERGRLEEISFLEKDAKER